ncbi:MAG: hypothetical protein AAF393_07860 [Pseudomonadota bacterium]
MVWSRINGAQMGSIDQPHFKRKLMDIRRELNRTHEWDIPNGFRDPETRAPSNYANEEAGQAKRAKADPKALKGMFQRCGKTSDSREATAAA